jgi:hypothetical protein
MDKKYVAAAALVVAAIVVAVWWFMTSVDFTYLPSTAINGNDVETKKMMVKDAVSYAKQKGYPAFCRKRRIADNMRATTIFKTATTNQVADGKYNTFIL